ncbi:unnamed protein product [Adineta ricciae]|uniref:SAYSvFN domain-containing protein n=1 Tax=Adineta ricciae TaxID=249248 RepID=A0A814E3Q8_ADIRI|nr:unnamed protein product [Adineta ricciae]
MEAKLAEFRKSNSSKQPLINWHRVISRVTSMFPSLSYRSSEVKAEEIEEKVTWQIILLKFFVWLTLFVIFIRLEFGAIYFILSLLYLIWTNLSSHRRRADQLSAYSVFNPNFEKLQGTFSAEDYDRQLRHGGSPLLSS